MKIICIGRNYVAHAQELNNAIPEKPVWFMKPDSALLLKNKPLYYPPFTKKLHYETELVYKINRNGKHIEEKFAHKYYDSVALGYDFTARDIQDIQKSKGLPWEEAKGFDGSAALSPFVKIENLSSKDPIYFKMYKNGELTQNGDTSLMLFPIDKVIAYISQFVTLKMGDLIYTGTPAGVGAVQIGDILEAYLDDKLMLKTEIK